MSDDRPKCQLRITREEQSMIMKTLYAASTYNPACVFEGYKPLWTEEDERVKAVIELLAPDLAAETGRGPMLFELVVVEPSWLLTTGEVKRWTKDPIPKEKR